MGKLHLWPEEITVSGSHVTASAILEDPAGNRQVLWYRLPEKYQFWLTSSCDPFVVAMIFKFMSQPGGVVVHGQVSPSLLRNLTEYQAIWHCWHPERYQPVAIEAEVEQESLGSEPTERVLTAFSGGVDSCFTVLRHRRGLCGRLQQELEAGLMVHGFDIPLSQSAVFEQAAAKSRQVLASLGVDLIVMATNFRQLGQDWEDAHGTGIASCLMLLQGRYGAGLIPSTEPYQKLVSWGSNPLSDPLLANSTFSIIHDGAGFTRLEKIEQLAQWPAALQDLRVCWQGGQKDRNCGTCEKCIRTILGFRVLGLPLPSCFERDVRDRQILNLAFKKLNKIQNGELELILKKAQENNRSESWISLLKIAVISNQYLQFLIAPVRQAKAFFKDRFFKDRYG